MTVSLEHSHFSEPIKMCQTYQGSCQSRFGSPPVWSHVTRFISFTTYRTGGISSIQRHRIRVYDFNLLSTYSTSMLQKLALKYAHNCRAIAGDKWFCLIVKKTQKTALQILVSAEGSTALGWTGRMQMKQFNQYILRRGYSPGMWLRL